MPDNNLPVMPTHIDDYQPPQVQSSAPGFAPNPNPNPVPVSAPAPASSATMNMPTGMNPPPAPNMMTSSLNRPLPHVSSQELPSFTDQLRAQGYGQRPLASASASAMPVSTPASTQTPAAAKSSSESVDELTKIVDQAKQAVDQLDERRTGATVTMPEVKVAAPTSFPVSTPVAEAPATAPASAAPVEDNSPLAPNQSLEAQNIFDLLGVSDGQPAEKEAFLDELQEVIWEDFLARDAEMLLTEAEFKQLNEIKAKGKAPEIQEEMLGFLEKLVPDLEDIMMDKAMELKEDMVLERIAGMKEFHAQNPQALQQLTQVDKLVGENQWADVSKLLNSIK